jgi:hypothetical protein
MRGVGVIMTNIWSVLGIVTTAGAIGGIANALLTHNTFTLPKFEKSGGNRILLPGILGNVFTGALAAALSWGLYGPLAEYNVIERAPTGENAVALKLTLSVLAGAVVVGMAGARWLTGEIDKRLLKAAVVKATEGASEPVKSEMRGAGPAHALNLAGQIGRGT